MSAPLRVLTLGESMGLLRGDGIGGFERLPAASIDTGGAEGNTAVGLARLGVPVTWLGRVGDDALGRRVCGDLRAEGVDVLAITDPAAPTGLMLKSTPRAGTTVIEYYRAGSAGSRLTPADLDRLDFAAYGIIHITGVTLALSASARATVHEAVDRARAHGLLVSFAVNHRSKLWDRDRARAAYLDLLPRVDIVFASDEEAELVSRPSGAVPLAELARALGALGPREAVVTLGDRGAIAEIDGAAHRIAADKISPVDTVGAGDAFAAGYLAARAAGHPAYERLRVATRCGAFACLHPGDWQGAARQSDLDQGFGITVVR
ncbi:sugar kinase [Microbacterium sp.]|uniref:sugar kinase n=1 Tax=Microbacterium TaxID=33882 RepID=UPI00324226D1|nr:sugar kinase [Sphingomonas sp. BLCC-B65]